MSCLIFPVDPGDDSMYAETMRAESREPRAESREPRAESREPRAESREPRAESREPRAESREPRAESREPRAESREPRAESREPRAESREPRAESREFCPRRGSPPSTSPPSRANLLRSDTDLSAAAAPAASACPGPGARGAGRAVSGLSAAPRGAPPESSPPAPGGLPPDRAAATGAGPAGAFARLRPALFRAAACLVVAAAALLALPGGASAQENPVRPSWSSHTLGPVGRRPVPADIRHVDERNATSSDIGDYNTFVQNQRGGGAHADPEPYSSQFRVVGSTAAVDARDNTGTTGTGVPIYWLNGAKVANNYADFYDGSWSNEANPKTAIGDTNSTTGINLSVPHGKQSQRNRVFREWRQVLRIGSNGTRNVREAQPPPAIRLSLGFSNQVSRQL